MRKGQFNGGRHGLLALVACLTHIRLDLFPICIVMTQHSDCHNG